MLNKKIGCILLAMFSIVDLRAVDRNVQGLFKYFGLGGLKNALEKFKGTYQPIEDLQVYQKYFSAKYMYDTTSKGDPSAPSIYKDRTKSSLVLKDGYAYQLKFETEGQDPKVTLEALCMKQGINEEKLKAIVDQIVKLVYGYFYEKSALAGYRRSGKYDLLASMIAKILNEVFYAYTKANNINNFAEFFNNEKIRTDFISPMVDELRENYSKKLTLGKDANITAQFGDNITKKISSMSISGYTETYVEDGSAVGALFNNDPRNLAQAWLLQRQYQKTYRLLDDLRNYEYSALASTGSLYSKPSLVIQGTETDVKYAYELSYQDTETKLVNFVLGSGFDLVALNKMALNIAKCAHGNCRSYLITNKQDPVSGNNQLTQFVINFVTSILFQAKLQGFSDFTRAQISVSKTESDANMASIIADITRDIYDELEKGQAGLKSNTDFVTELIKGAYNRKVEEYNDEQDKAEASGNPVAPKLVRSGTRDTDAAVFANSPDTKSVEEAKKALTAAETNTNKVQELKTAVEAQVQALKTDFQAVIDAELNDKKDKLEKSKKKIKAILKSINDSKNFTQFKQDLSSAETNADSALNAIKYPQNKTEADSIKAQVNELKKVSQGIDVYRKELNDLKGTISYVYALSIQSEGARIKAAEKALEDFAQKHNITLTTKPSAPDAKVALAGTRGAAVPTDADRESDVPFVSPPLPGPATPPEPDGEEEVGSGAGSPVRRGSSTRVSVTPATSSSDGVG